jgi:altronate dehydratase large subunit
MKIKGYLRANGEFGIRNHVLIFPTVICASKVAEAVSRAVPGTVYVNHPHGCGHLGKEREHMLRTMVGFCANPNVNSVLLIGLGCELLTPDVLGSELRKRQVRFETLSIQQIGGTTSAINKGIEIAKSLVRCAKKEKKGEGSLKQLRVGIKCGGSDTFSGLTANPALGAASDLLVAEGASVIMTEVPEMIGAEAVLVKRAASAIVAKRILEITNTMEQAILKEGVDIRGTEPSPGNIRGGLTTLEEKSLGAILKGGTTPIVEVVSYAEQPRKSGLIIMDGPALDAVSLTGMLAAGAQIIVFTTGRGSPMGSAISPVIKVATNSGMFASMQDDMDLNAGAVTTENMTISEMGKQIFNKIIAVTRGSKTRSEILQHHEFAIHNIGPAI